MASSNAIAAMTKGRKDKAAAQLANDKIDVMLYEAWCSDDATLYSERVSMNEMYGYDSPEAIDAYNAWYANLKRMPNLPKNKKAWGSSDGETV